MSSPNTQFSQTTGGVQISFTSEHNEEEHEIPTTPRGFVGLVCQCHNLNWHDPLNNGGICEYTYIDGKPHYQMKPHPTLGLPCCDKLNLRQVSMDEYRQVCKYQLFKPSCNLPKDIHDDLVTFINWGGGGSDYDERLDSSSPTHYKKHYSSLKEMYDAQIEKSQKEIEMCENMDFSDLNGDYTTVYGWKMFWDTDSNRLWDAETSLCCVGIMHGDENGEYIPIISEWAQETRKINPETKMRWGLPK